MITTPEQMREAAAHDNDLIRRGDAENANCIWLKFGPMGDVESVSSEPAMGHKRYCSQDAIRAIPIAPQPVAVTVKPLVWRGSYGCLIAKGVGVEYYAFTKGWNTSLDGTTHPAESREDAKAACQALHDSLLRAELTLQPADPMSDPRVVALVEAAKNLADVCSVVGVSSSPSLRRMRSALRAIGGEA